MTQTDKIKELITQKHTTSSGRCGLYIVDLQNELKLTIEELRPLLRKLYEQKFFIVREGLNGKLLCKKKIK